MVGPPAGSAGTTEQPGQQAPGAALDLDLGERCQIQEHRPARQRLAEHRDGEKSRGTREQERTGRRVGIHGELDGPDEVVAAALDLVDDDRPRPMRNEPHRIVERHRQQRRIVEAEEGPIADNSPGQGRLARLPRPVQDHDPERCEPVPKHRFDPPTHRRCLRHRHPSLQAPDRERPGGVSMIPPIR